MRVAAEFEHLRVVMVSPRNPLNIGAAARAMSNFGFGRLRVVNPYEVAFREARSAMGGAPVLANAEEFPSLAEAVADCTLVVGTTAARSRELHHPLKPLQEAAPLMRAAMARGAVALVFGSEKFGLSNQDMTHCRWLLHIPAREAHTSMNLGQAVAVCLYELAHGQGSAGSTAEGTRAKPARGATPATAAEIERITEVLLECLRASGYVKPRTKSSTDEKTRRLVRRLGLTADDAEVLLGMLRQIAWGLGRRHS